jgi:hypothetical protein
MSVLRVLTLAAQHLLGSSRFGGGCYLTSSQGGREDEKMAVRSSVCPSSHPVGDATDYT